MIYPTGGLLFGGNNFQWDDFPVCRRLLDWKINAVAVLSRRLHLQWDSFRGTLAQRELLLQRADLPDGPFLGNPTRIEQLAVGS